MNPQHHQCNIHIIGLGVAEQAVLGVNALQALNKASLLIGSERQLAHGREIPTLALF